MTARVAARYAKVTARTSCGACGQPLPLTTLTDDATCAYCNAGNEISHALWTRILTLADQASDYGSSHEGTQHLGGREVIYTIEAAAPCCEACSAPLPTDALGVGARRNFACTSCGDPASTEPVPSWVARIVDPARQLYSVDPKDTLGGHVALTAPVRAIQPIVMSCPRCGGGLEITATSARLLACRYCAAEVYLPDEVWRRLHPIKQVRPFFLRFEGPSLARRARETEERARALREEAERRAAAEQAAARAREEADRAARLATAKSLAWAAALVTTLTMGALAIGSWWSAWAGVDRLPFALPAGIVLAPMVLVATILVSRPIQIASRRSGEWMIFVTWFWIPFALLTPVVGQLIALARALILARGSFAGATIRSGGTSTRYPPLKLTGGESRPAGLFFFALATLWPAMLLPLIAPSVVMAVLGT